MSLSKHQHRSPAQTLIFKNENVTVNISQKFHPKLDKLQNIENNEK
jgi:hypothetical protein